MFIFIQSHCSIEFTFIRQSTGATMNTGQFPLMPLKLNLPALAEMNLKASGVIVIRFHHRTTAARVLNIILAP